MTSSNFYELIDYKFWGIKFSCMFWSINNIPGPAKYTTQTTSNTVSGRIAAIERCTTKLVIFPIYGSGDKLGKIIADIMEKWIKKHQRTKGGLDAE